MKNDAALKIWESPSDALDIELVDRILARATRSEAPIEFLGTQNFERSIRVYEGEDRDWVLAPIDLDPLFKDHGGSLPIPREELKKLSRLIQGGVDFPAVFIGHDIPAGSRRALDNATSTAIQPAKNAPAVISEATARGLLPRIPPPQRTLEASQRYGTACEKVLNVLQQVAKVSAEITVTSLRVLEFTDPVLVGALPLGAC